MDDDLPFAGLKVFDATQGVAGPHCAMLLAQNGADVVKAEPLEGDWGRKLGRTYEDYCAYFLTVNRGKRSIALDLKNPEGLAIAQRLAAEADVVLESFRPGIMARFGLDYASVKKTNPNVVYLSVTGFGQTGPNSKQPVTDSVMQAFSGLMTINRDFQGTPQRIGVIAIDILTGLYAFQAVSAALYAKAMKGVGKYIDCSLMLSAGAFLHGKMLEFHLQGPEQQALGEPVGTFRTTDGYININARRDNHFKSFCGLIGREDMLSDPRFMAYDARIGNRDALYEIIRPVVAERSTAEWAKDLDTADILNAPVFDFGDYFVDPQVKAADAIAWMQHSGVGRVPVPTIPGVATPPEGSFLATCPHNGEHTVEILRELGYDDAAIDALRAGKAVAVPDRAAAPE